MRRVSLVALTVATLLVGCTGADLDDPAFEHGASLIHVELDARRAGAVSWLDGRPWMDPGPVRVEPGAVIAVRAPTGHGAHVSRFVRVGGAEIVQIAGERAQIRRFGRGREVDETSLVVQCDEETAFRVAHALGEDVTVSLHSPYGYQLDGADLLARASGAGALRAVSDVIFVRSTARSRSSADAGAPASSGADWTLEPGSDAIEVGRADGLLRRAAVLPIERDHAGEPASHEVASDDARSARLGEGSEASLGTGAHDGVPLAALEAADLVGCYRSAERVLVLDAEGGYELEGDASDRARGRWTLRDGRVELERFGGGRLLYLLPDDDGSLGFAGAPAFHPQRGADP